MKEKMKMFGIVILAILLSVNTVIILAQPTQAGEVIEDSDGNRTVHMSGEGIDVNVTFLETIPKDYEAPYSIYFGDTATSVKVNYTLYNETDVKSDSSTYDTDTTSITEGEWDNGTMDALDVEDDGSYTANFTLSVNGTQVDTIEVDVTVSDTAYSVDETTRLLAKIAPLLIILALISGIVALIAGISGTGGIGGGW